MERGLWGTGDAVPLSVLRSWSRSQPSNSVWVLLLEVRIVAQLLVARADVGTKLLQFPLFFDFRVKVE